MAAGHHRHRGTPRTRLLNDTQLLFDRVPHPRPSPPAQRISRDDLFCEDAHQTPTWTPTMCPLSPSWVHRAPPAMRPKPVTVHFRSQHMVGTGENRQVEKTGQTGARGTRSTSERKSLTSDRSTRARFRLGPECIAFTNGRLEFSTALRADSFPRRFVQQRESLRDSPAPARGA